MSAPAAAPDRPPAAMYLVCAAAVGLALVGYALTGLLDLPEYRPALLGACVLLAAVGLSAVTLQRRRSRVCRDLTQALAPLLKPDDKKGMVRCSKRKNGTPTVVKISYPPQWPDQDDTRRKELRQVVATRLGARVEATWRTHRHEVVCRVVGDADTIVESDAPTQAAPDDTAEQAATRRRAADVVQAVLGATATVTNVQWSDGSADPASIDVKYGTTSRDLSPVFRQKALNNVQAKLPGEWRDLWNFEGNTVRFEVRPPFPSNVPYWVSRAKSGKLHYCVGEDGTSRPWVLGSKDPHHLVVGPTGTGKSVAIRALVLSAVTQGIPVILCDPKKIEYLDFADIPGVVLVTETSDIAAAIMYAEEWVTDRYNRIQAGVAKEGSFGKFLLVMDEYTVFKDLANNLWEEEKAEKKEAGAVVPKGSTHPCLKSFRNMILLARSAEGHVVLGMQRPDASILDGAVRDSMRKRTGLDQHTAETAKMMWGDHRTGTQLPSVQGRAMAHTGSGPEEVQVLRVLPPGSDGHSPEDAEIWEEAIATAADPALWEGTYVPPQLLALKEAREHRMKVLRARYAAEADSDGAGSPATAQPAALSLEKPAPEPEPEAGADGEAPDPEPTQEWGDADVYDVEVGDWLMIEDETGVPEIVTVVDLHFTDEGDGDEGVEVTYVSHDSGEQAVRTLPVDEAVQRRPAA